MSVESEICDVLSGIAEITEVFDTKVEDEYRQTGTIAVFSCVSDSPDASIDGTLLGHEQTWTVEIRALDLPTARSVKDLVITALHNYSGESIQSCSFESAPAEFFAPDLIVQAYCVPIDFAISI